VIVSLVVLFVTGGPIAPGAERKAAPQSGIVVESVAKGSAGERAGLQPGDVLLSWVRLPSPPANPTEARGEMQTPFDWMDVETEQGPRGEVQLIGIRDGREFSVMMAPVRWGTAVRPQVSDGLLAQYQEANRAIEAKESEKAIALWREAAGAVQREGKPGLACWFFMKLGDALSEVRRWDAAHSAYGDALKAAQQGLQGSASARVWQAEGEAYKKGNEPGKAAEAYREALGISTRLSPESLASAASLNRLGNAALDRGDVAAAEEFHRRALAIRERLAPGSLDVAASLNNLGNAVQDRGDLAGAQELHKRSLAILEVLAPGSLSVATSLNNLGNAARDRGDLATAEEFHKRALAIRERLAPGSLAVAASLNNLGSVARDRGDLALAEEFFKRSLVIKEVLAPGSLDVASALNNLGAVALDRGDLAAAEEFFKRDLAITEVLAPRSLDVAMGLNNLGNVARARGDLAAAAESHQRSLAIREVLAPGSLDVAVSLNNLGNVAQDRGELATAEELFRRSVAIKEVLAPGSLDVATGLNNLGSIARARGDLAAAAEFYRRSLAIGESLAPGSLQVAWSLSGLGDAAGDRGDLVRAEDLHQEALAILQALSPGSVDEAECWNSLGIIARRRGDRVQALESFRRAIEALEAQKGKLGGTEDARSGFAAKYGHFYRDYMEILLESQRQDEALHVLERSRARSLLSMLAERDLVFASEIPADLARERKLIDGDYDRTQAKLGELSPEKDAQAIEGLLVRLRELRQKQGEIAERVKKASPRLASLQYPEPLDLAGIGKALDPGTVLLSYSVGEDKTYLFVVQPTPKLLPRAPSLSVFTLPLGENDLRGKVESFRNLIDQRSGSDQALIPQGKQLYEGLVKPAEALIEGSERVVILPDGPLHTLPFAALVREPRKGRPSYFVEWKPLHSVVSATVYAEIQKSRRDRQTQAPVSVMAAFGDPVYPALSKEKADSIPNAELRSAVRGGFSLNPLPGTRKEVEGITGLYGTAAVAYLGVEATEERARSLDKDVRYVHFASHGLLNERFPLDSALALTIPEKVGDGQENGLLQAWEIFQQVRIDADLVTLSACETGLGKEMGGEGLVGLTRAFQYAGARSVLASLWSVSDVSTADLMRRFYTYLKAGKTKDEALRSAQVDLIHGATASHPFHWAAFQLVGDWR
jgi:CHAT domain-containing protein/Tfp pilus assembly protein PilF